MRLLGSIALLKALPPHVYIFAPPAVSSGPGSTALGRVNSLTTLKLIAPAIQTPSVFFNASAAAATSLSPIMPSSRTNGNLLVAWLLVKASGKTFSVGGGWTIGDTSADGAACWAWRYVDGTEAVPVFSWSGAADCTTDMVQLTGVKSSGAIGASAKANGSGTTASLSGIVTGANLSRALAIVTAQGATSLSVASGYTSAKTLNTGRGSYLVESQSVPVAGASGSISSTLGSGTWQVFLIEIKRP
jgi:hypothetical protein